jgi:hypothetical protein
MELLFLLIYGWRLGTVKQCELVESLSLVVEDDGGGLLVADNVGGRWRWKMTVVADNGGERRSYLVSGFSNILLIIGCSVSNS